MLKIFSRFLIPPARNLFWESLGADLFLRSSFQVVFVLELMSCQTWWFHCFPPLLLLHHLMVHLQYTVYTEIWRFSVFAWIFKTKNALFAWSWSLKSSMSLLTLSCKSTFSRPSSFFPDQSYFPTVTTRALKNWKWDLYTQIHTY